MAGGVILENDPEKDRVEYHEYPRPSFSFSIDSSFILGIIVGSCCTFAAGSDRIAKMAASILSGDLLSGLIVRIKDFIVNFFTK